MKSSTNEIVLFLNNLRKDLLLKEYPKLDSDIYPTIRLSQLESYFIYDFSKGLIVQQKGLSCLLGSSKKNVDMADIISHFHSEDSKEVQTILADGIRQMTQLIAPKGTNVLKLSFRLINSNGEEIRVMSENVIYSNFNDGKTKTVLVKFTKIDFLESNPHVNWWLNPEYMDASSLQRKIGEGQENIFSEREFEVVKGIVSDESSTQIADRLNLSKHTIITHRKNIFLKSKSHSIDQLKLYCLKRRLVSHNVQT